MTCAHGVEADHCYPCLHAEIERLKTELTRMQKYEGSEAERVWNAEHLIACLQNEKNQMYRLGRGIEIERDDLKARLAKVVEALQGLLDAMCGPVGFSTAVRMTTGTAFPWPAEESAEAKARAALAAAQQKDHNRDMESGDDA